MTKIRGWLLVLPGVLLTACPEPDDGASTAGETSNAEGNASSSSPSTSTDTDTDSDTVEPTDSTDDETSSESTGSETEEGDPDPDPVEPSICPAAAGPIPVLSLSSVSPEMDPCDIPTELSMRFSDWGDDYVSFSSCMDAEIESISIDFALPNNTWSPYFQPQLLDFGCKQLHLSFEPTGDGECRLTRLDIVDPAYPELPSYSIGATAEHLSVAGLTIEPVNPAPCDSECRTGTVNDLRFSAAGSEAVLEAGAFPWTISEFAGEEYRLIRFDSIALNPTEAEGCAPEPAVEHSAWAMVRLLPGEVGPPEEAEPDDPLETGACLEEVDDPQPDSFVGDGVPDMTMHLRTVDAEPPLELYDGARIHVQGTSFNCCDDDVIVRESLVVRAYPSERFVVGTVDSRWNVPPKPSQSFFDAIGEDLDSWLYPFTFSAHDDLICSKAVEYYNNHVDIGTRMRLYVDAGSCPTARLIDEAHGAFAGSIFVRASNMRVWEPGGSVDTTSHSRVFLSRQVCEPGGCPPTADVFTCVPDNQWPEDEVTMTFGYWYEPVGSGYDHVCEILWVDDDAEMVEYTLDCGMLCPMPDVELDGSYQLSLIPC